MLTDFYRIVDHSVIPAENAAGDQTLAKSVFTVALNPDHPVYKGHFPGNPVVPGICQVQIIKELVSLILQKEVFLFRSDNIKFLSMMVPSQITSLTIHIDIRKSEQDQWVVNAIISNDQQVFIKFKGVFRQV